MTTWAQLPSDQLQRIITAYRERDDTTLTIEASATGMTMGSLRRYCRQYNTHEALIDRAPMVPAPVVRKRLITPARPLPRLTNIEYDIPGTDCAAWVDYLQKRQAHQPEMTIMHACDIHAPFHSPTNIALFHRMQAIAKPDVIVVGSDFADMYLTTSFDINPDIVTYDDELDCFETHWNMFINATRKISPKAKLVFIWGNHERRLFRHLQANAPQMRKRVVRDFLNVIRCGGAVTYLGEIDSVRIGALIVEHGNRHNEHVTKSRLIDEGAQVSLMFGHVHKRNFYEIRGADYSVNAISSGALCDDDPHYATTGTSARSGRKWTCGTAVATMSLEDYPVQFENVAFNRGTNGRYAYFRGQKIKEVDHNA